MVRIAITGGGTGGHIYPALEIARNAIALGDEAIYFGSVRGQEGSACSWAAIRFHGFNSEPLYPLWSIRGWRAGARILRASAMARAALIDERPDVLFSTGGYAAAPVVRAARALRIPYVLFEPNSVPGRTNRMFARGAARIAVVYDAAIANFDSERVVRTGLPIRKELRDAAAGAGHGGRSVFVVGGSQGSSFLNELMPKVARITANCDYVHISGAAHFESVTAAVGLLGADYRVEPFLDAGEMARAYLHAGVVVARSGSSLSEFALFRLPSVLIPLPTAAGDHQTANAVAFERIGAATHVPQSSATPQAVARAIMEWLEDESRTNAARTALARFDAPDATERIVGLLHDVAEGRR